MDQPQCIFRQENSSLYGISAGLESEVVLTIQDSGVHCFNVDRRENSNLWLLGDPNLTFTASAVLDPSSQSLSAAVCNTASSAQPGRKDTLLSWPINAFAGTLASIAQRSSLPGRVHSLHPLFSATIAEGAQTGSNPAAHTDSGTASRRSGVAVVLQDGSASTASAFQNGAGSEARAEHPDRNTVAACSFYEQLAVVYNSAASDHTHLYVDVYHSQAGHLLMEKSVRLPVPSSGTYLTSASLQSDSLTVTWSTGALQVFGLQSSSSKPGLALPSVQTEALLLSFRKLGVTCPARPQPSQGAAGFSTPASKQQHDSLPNGIVKGLAGTPSSTTSKKHKKEKASSKKRKEVEAEVEASAVAATLPEGSALLSSSSFAEGSVALASWETHSAQQQAAELPAKQGGLRLSLFDACYGGVHHSQLLQGLHAPTATARFQVAASHSGRSLAVQLDGTIYAARLSEVSRGSLASLVGCFAPGATSEAGQAAQAVFNLPASASVQQPHATPAWHAAAPAASRHPDEAEMAVPMPSRWSPAAAAEATPIFERAQQQFGGTPLSPAACSAAVLELLRSVQAAHLEIPSGLHARAVLTCGQASCWQDLTLLLQYQPLPSLSLAPGLVPLLIAGGQHPLLARLLPRARDLPADDIASALQSLLLPAPAASAAAAPSASSHAQQLRSRAEQAVSAAEACEPGHERHYLIASATVATAVLEGFRDQEVSLHPLVAMHHDSTVLLAALSQLSQRQAVQLLRYLLQWMRHHTGLLQHPATAAAAASGTLEGTAIPQYRTTLLWLGAVLDAHMVALSMLPSCHQVLEALQALTQEQLSGLDQLLGMRGMLEHIECRAPLPTGQSMAVATYAIEVLDLRVA
ncbi:hypothetical protein WJX74_004306 [Apatococcus lobatus]|uniref:Small-subunit processome Utp12 domain-containing protein n=1 Tax=Apatococcus lobatus TaxID=904363 RepID=A0AAW1QBJ5_9CHLO